MLRKILIVFLLAYSNVSFSQGIWKNLVSNYSFENVNTYPPPVSSNNNKGECLPEGIGSMEYIDGNLLRTGNHFYSILGQEIGCGIQSGTQYIRDLKYPLNPMHICINLAIQQGIIEKNFLGNTYQIDYAPDANSNLPNNFDIDYVKYWKQLPCAEPININTFADFNLNDEIYNVTSGSTVHVNGNITLNNYDQLIIIASDSIILEPGFTVDVGSDFESKILPYFCTKSNTEAPMIDNNDFIQIMDTKNKETSDNLPIKLTVYPNPNNGNFTVSFYEMNVYFDRY